MVKYARYGVDIIYFIERKCYFMKRNLIARIAFILIAAMVISAFSTAVSGIVLRDNPVPMAPGDFSSLEDGEDTPDPSGNPKTGDNTLPCILALAALAAAGTALVRQRKTI